MDIVRGEDVIIFSVLFDNCRRPNGFLHPRKTGHVNNRFIFFPVLKIVGDKHIMVELLLIRETSRNVNIIFSVVNSCFRVGMPRLGNRVVKFNIHSAFPFVF